MKRILIAAAELETARITSHVLEADFALAICTSVAEARPLLSRNIDMVMCGIHFDEGRMFDLLRYAKADPDIKSIPFLCINSTDGLSPAIVQSVEIASKALGADGFVELYEWRNKLGDKQAFEKLRALIDSLT